MQTTWRPFAWVGATLRAGTMGTALASPLYPFYQLLWDLKPSIFILYGLRSVRQVYAFLGVRKPSARPASEKLIARCQLSH